MDHERMTDSIYDLFCEGEHGTQTCALCDGPASAALAIGTTIDTTYGSRFDGTHFTWVQPQAVSQHFGDAFVCDACIQKALDRRDIVAYHCDQDPIEPIDQAEGRIAAFIIGARDAVLIASLARDGRPHDITYAITDPEAFMRRYHRSVKPKDPRSAVRSLERLGLTRDTTGRPSSYADGVRAAQALALTLHRWPTDVEITDYAKEAEAIRSGALAVLRQFDGTP